MSRESNHLLITLDIVTTCTNISLVPKICINTYAFSRYTNLDIYNIATTYAIKADYWVGDKSLKAGNQASWYLQWLFQCLCISCKQQLFWSLNSYYICGDGRYTYLPMARSLFPSCTYCKEAKDTQIADKEANVNVNPEVFLDIDVSY